MIRYIASILFFLTLSLFGYEDYSKIAQLYAQNQASGTDYLAFRDIPFLFRNSLSSEKDLLILDYGCGTGLSSRFIKQLATKNSAVIGIDISESMLQEAKLADPAGIYLKVDKEIPFPDSTFDFVYCNFVLFELPSQKELVSMLKEIRRTMKSNAYLIATTGTPEMYNRKNNWATLDANFPENDTLQSGDLAKVSLILSDGIITFHDYYWTEKDYQQCFAAAELSAVSVHYPLGEEKEILDWTWKDETKVAPYVIFVLKKS